jgi:hypothetical protein
MYLLYIVLVYRVKIPNNDGKEFPYFVSLSVRPFHTRLKIFLYMHNRWNLLFQMV